MSLRLILMRHAKSAWDDPTIEDHDRLLNKRGRDSADALGDWLRLQGLKPDLALVSSAERTLETFHRLRIDVPFRACDSLYLASADRMLDLIQAQPVQTLLLLGHNPGIAELANLLVGTQTLDGPFQDYPTGATSLIRFDTPTWGSVAFRTGHIEKFIVPRDLLPDDKQDQDPD